MEKIIVTQQFAGMRLDRFLSLYIITMSRSKVQQAIENGLVTVNGNVAAKKHRIVEDDIITVSKQMYPSHDQAFPKPQNIPLEILYEDDSFIAVNKPAGLVVHPGNGNPDSTLVNALLHYTQKLSDGSSSERPGIVHRLDKATSGVVIVAKNNRIHSRLAKAFANRQVAKTYIGICIGGPQQCEGKIALSLGRSRHEPVKRAVSPSGKQADTSYKLIIQRSGISVVYFFPHTGRTHQIRVHSSSAGFPILGDILYGGGKGRILRIDPVERPFAYSIYKCFMRHALHAKSISFNHPESGKPLCIQAPVPNDFKNALRQFNDHQLLTTI